jgi:hypothetical protein
MAPLASAAWSAGAVAFGLLAMGFKGALAADPNNFFFTSLVRHCFGRIERHGPVSRMVHIAAICVTVRSILDCGVQS